MTMIMDENSRFFDAELIVKALRDSGYKDTYHALAELIDNSIQAGSRQIHVYLFAENTQLKQRISENIAKIAVLDDGIGMPQDVLIKALKFGDRRSRLSHTTRVPDFLRNFEAKVLIS